MIEVKGKCGISAKIILDSVSAVTGERMVTMEIEYPRIILSELNTHRMLSKNSASSRAIPFDKMVENLKGIPVRFGQANKGMQDKGVDYKGLGRFLNMFASDSNGLSVWVEELCVERLVESFSCRIMNADVIDERFVFCFKYGIVTGRCEVEMVIDEF